MNNEILTQEKSILSMIDNIPYIAHSLIAQHTDNQEKSVRNIITKYMSDFEVFGQVHFKNATVKNSVGATNQKKTYFLNEQQATLLMTYLKNSEKVRNFKVRLVNDFFEMRNELKAKSPKDIDIEYIRKRTEQIETSGKQLISFKKTFYEIGITRKEELAITSNRAVAKETGVDFIELAELKGVSTPVKYFTVTELCQKVMNSDKFSEEAKKSVSTKKGDKPRPQNLNKLLETNGFQTKVDEIWKPTNKAKDLADFVQNKSKYSDKTVFHTVWKIEVLEELF